VNLTVRVQKIQDNFTGIETTYDSNRTQFWPLENIALILQAFCQNILTLKRLENLLHNLGFSLR